MKKLQKFADEGITLPTHFGKALGILPIFIWMEGDQVVDIRTRTYWPEFLFPLLAITYQLFLWTIGQDDDYIELPIGIDGELIYGTEEEIRDLHGDGSSSN